MEVYEYLRIRNLSSLSLLSKEIFWGSFCYYILSEFSINNCLWRIVRIFWPNVILNENLWKSTNVENIATMIRRRKWNWLDMDTLYVDQVAIYSESYVRSEYAKREKYMIMDNSLPSKEPRKNIEQNQSLGE